MSITTNVEKGELPLESADRLVSKEQRIRKSSIIHWLNILMKNNKFSIPSITKLLTINLE